jgi:cytoskeleton-binding toxin CbtA-like protein
MPNLNKDVSVGGVYCGTRVAPGLFAEEVASNRYVIRHLAAPNYTKRVGEVMGSKRIYQAMRMNVSLFQQIADQLLQKHYGLSLNDTHLTEEKIVAECIGQRFRPYQVINEHAEESDLVRIDIEGFYGVPSHCSLSSQDELEALYVVNPIEILGDQPTTCPHCGMRSEFDDVGSVTGEGTMQHHRCPDKNCGYEFLAENE